MATCPPEFVTPPPPDTYVGGLYSAATIMPLPNDPHWQCGVQYEVNNCAVPSGWAETCPPDTPEVKLQTFVPEFQQATLFHIVLGVDCRLVGTTLPDLRRRLVTAMQACAQTTVERIYWTGEMGNTPRLAGPAAVDPNNPAPGEVVVLAPAPLSITNGIVALESYLGKNYCGNGVIHAPGGLSAWASRHNQICGACDRGALRTAMGTRWAFGKGYEINTGPGGVPAPAGTAWMYATGQVAIWQGPITIPNEADLEAAFNRTDNTVALFAEQTFVVSHECTTAAVPVTVGCDC